MKRVVFFTDNAPLNRALLEFEDNVGTALSDLDKAKPSLPRVIRPLKSGAMVRPGQLAIVDGAANFELLLAQPTLEQEALELVVVKERAGGTLTLRPIGVSVNGAATKAIAAVGRYQFIVADGAYWGDP